MFKVYNIIYIEIYKIVFIYKYIIIIKVNFDDTV